MHPRAHAPHCCVLPRCRSSLSELSFFVSFPLFILILPPESPGRTAFSPQAAASSLVSRYVYFCFSCCRFSTSQSTANIIQNIVMFHGSKFRECRKYTPLLRIQFLNKHSRCIMNSVVHFASESSLIVQLQSYICLCVLYRCGELLKFLLNPAIPPIVTHSSAAIIANITAASQCSAARGRLFVTSDTSG